ncbi:2-oxoacid:ferredoxin oxidoreductase, gamma subunit [Desulfocapsa sulfexigens DSM 10523]|uniref:2-oxoacid:ferredoxin oxidoreductase, gamma subunit n=1 Tax=Desulfocapsa sulfexigens (strain DSM 10523 / SB164P1) TaxID=1167006 RepID=M1NZI8_DESSD|nr:indolepyruvate oxidoreductase subunit beta [Desulfocapsa sulfexigens]AGF76683.1 2-oxoacid:ferredoxin oxidoreductase, gamma subunit [Desulfocapsa sulfexigens DSM 10523]
MAATGNILFSGVGGQGILLASEVTAYALLAAGYDAKKSEVHGMAQRGGSVTAQLRYGDKVYSPLIEPGKADILISFEMMEAARYLPYLHQESKVIVNTQQIKPPSVAMGQVPYPANVLDAVSSLGIQVVSVDAFDIARDAGEVKAANIVMVGAMSAFLPMGVEVYENIINTRIPERFREVNMKAFAAGRKITA